MTRPLTSLKVLDFTTLLPGPFATMLLADMGAEVLRIEAPQRPDMVREMPPFDGEVSAWHGVLNRSKRSLGLNLKQPGATAVVKKLITDGGYDIIIEQFRPGVMARLGLDYATLHELNPRLIYCSITGYGQTGPLATRAGHDINYVALSGVASYSGRQTEGPVPLGVQLADVGGGSLGALVGLLAAVIQRQVDGVGQQVDISMFDMLVAWQAHLISRYLVGGMVPGREQLPLNGGQGNYDFFRTQDGRFFSVGSLEPKFWVGFCHAVERPDLATKAYDLDPVVQKALHADVQMIIGQRPFSAWVAFFADLDVCIEPVLTIPEVVTHKQSQARELIVDVPLGNGRMQQQVGTPIKFSGSKPIYKHAGTQLGAHTNEILVEIGYDTCTIRQLRKIGAVV